METDNDGDSDGDSEVDKPGVSDIFELQAMQARVNAGFGGEFGVRADFKYFAVAHYHDAISVFNCRESMCDDDGGAPAHQGLQCRLYLALGFAIERGCRFIE